MNYDYDDYDGLTGIDAARFRNRIERNDALDCRDPDHDPSICRFCCELPEEEEE